MRRNLWSLLAALIVGVGAPALELALACRRSTSESCVWGRALLPVNVVASLVLIGVPTFFITKWFLGRRPGAL